MSLLSGLTELNWNQLNECDSVSTVPGKDGCLERAVLGEVLEIVAAPLAQEPASEWEIQDVRP